MMERNGTWSRVGNGSRGRSCRSNFEAGAQRMSKIFLGKRDGMCDSGGWNTRSPHIRGPRDKANPQVGSVWPTEFYGLVVVANNEGFTLKFRFLLKFPPGHNWLELSSGCPFKQGLSCPSPHHSFLCLLVRPSSVAKYHRVCDVVFPIVE